MFCNIYVSFDYLDFSYKIKVNLDYTIQNKYNKYFRSFFYTKNNWNQDFCNYLMDAAAKVVLSYPAFDIWKLKNIYLNCEYSNDKNVWFCINKQIFLNYGKKKILQK